MDPGAEEARLGARGQRGAGGNSPGASRPQRGLRRGPVATPLIRSISEVLKTFALKTWGK